MLQTRALGGEPGNGLLPGGLLWVYGWIPTHYEMLGILLLNEGGAKAIDPRPR